MTAMNTSKTLTVALVQEINHGDAEANLAVIESRVAEAAAQGARLVLLQELHNGAYFCQHESTAEFDLAEPVPGPSTARLGALAKKHGVVIVGSLFERRAAGLYHNTAVVLEKDGTLLGKYRKMHIPDDPGFYEKFYFTPGDLGVTPIDTSVGRLGVLVALEGAGDQAVLKEVGRKIALHVAGTPTPPLALNEGDLDPAAVEKEKKFLTDQALESGKPLAVVEKMIEGRIRKWQEEVVLLKQPFVMNPDQTIEQLIAETAKETGAPVAVKAFVRFALGEGVEKKQDDFAAEVASMTGQG